ncbi:rhamnogalacturonan acetylesterase [Dysgonomonas sp. GY617]|uniref:rhamnogalacturonan acetylesterase n=1 Tax=Dysgonomonas sp. GY617 TaxID=2780420 RepID=UPI0018841579|nr:rhamnogalacturonan acetylesterase [Dysgonomonas sp. GY617]MBF0574382.1 rhamnogalacturonan acetylesterase [Dysgonomonas sp. GY617]
MKSVLIIFLGVFGLLSPAMAIDYKFYLAEGKKTKGFTSVAPHKIYIEGSYGYDLGTLPKDGKPFFFSVDVPEGNYLVKVVLGSKDSPGNTTVKAESRRLMLKNIPTEKGEFVTHEFVVNIRNTKISENESVKIKPREIGKLIWDNKLTLEFNGDNPSVQSIEIKSADNLVTLFLAGNSTVVDEANEPWCGWGQAFPLFFSSKVAIANYAESGEAANTFVSSKRFEKLLTKIKKGDYLFIEFGHNDQKQKGEGKGPYTSYTSDLKYLVDEARAKGAIPVLVTSMHRRSFDENGKVINTHGEYPNAVRLLAKEENVPLIDLNNMSKTLYEAWGVEGSKKAFVHYAAGTFPDQEKALEDNTHFNPYGGYEIARCIIKGIIESNLLIEKYIKKEYRDYDPAYPDVFETFHIPLTPFYSTVKPDGN